MIDALAILIIAALAFAAGYKVAQQAGNAILADWLEALAWSRARVSFLELTIDEVRAKQLETTPPATPDAPPSIKLPEAIQKELSMIEDEEGRQEYTQQAYDLMAAFPDIEPDDAVARLFN